MKIMQFKVQTGQKVLDLQGHNGDVCALSLNPKNQNVIVTGSVGRTGWLWDLRKPRSIQTFWEHDADASTPAHFCYLQQGQDGKFIL